MCRVCAGRERTKVKDRQLIPPFGGPFVRPPCSMLAASYSTVDITFVSSCHSTSCQSLTHAELISFLLLF